MLSRHGRADEAIPYLRKAIRLIPDQRPQSDERQKYDEKQFHYDLATALLVQGKIDESLAEFHKTIELNSDDVASYNNIAWIRATHPDAKYRNAAEAIACAEHACGLLEKNEKTKKEPPPAALSHLLDTLAAAYAEGGQFDQAVQTTGRALTLAKKAGDKELLATLQKHRKLFEAHQPVRDVPKPGAGG